MVTHAQPSIDWAHRWLKGRITNTFKIGDNGPRIKALQIYLSNKGYDPGKADGVWGKNTQLAYSQWAKDQGFEGGSDDKSAVRATPKVFTYIRREIKTPTPRSNPTLPQPPLPRMRPGPEIMPGYRAASDHDPAYAADGLNTARGPDVSFGAGSGFSAPRMDPSFGADGLDTSRGPDVNFSPGGGFSAPPLPPTPPPLPPMSGLGMPPLPPPVAASVLPRPPMPPSIGAPPSPAEIMNRPTLAPPPPPPTATPNFPAGAPQGALPPLPAVAGGSAGAGPMPNGPGIGDLLQPQTPGEQMNRPDMMPPPPPPANPNFPAGPRAGDPEALKTALMGPGKPPGMTYEQMIQLLAQAGAGG